MTMDEESWMPPSAQPVEQAEPNPVAINALKRARNPSTASGSTSVSPSPRALKHIKLTPNTTHRLESWADTIGKTPSQPTKPAPSPSPAKAARGVPLRRLDATPQQGMPQSKRLIAPAHCAKWETPVVVLQKNGIALPMKQIFDPWNACTTGHQRAENRLSGSTSWHESRDIKLKEQYKDRTGRGGKRVADTVGAGSENFGKDGRKADGSWEKGASGLRRGGQKSIMDCFNVGGAKKENDVVISPPEDWTSTDPQAAMITKEEIPQPDSTLNFTNPTEPSLNMPSSTILSGVVIYINGSIYPLISDHFLKHLITHHGGNSTLYLGRKRVTHVILTHKQQNTTAVSPWATSSDLSSKSTPFLPSTGGNDALRSAARDHHAAGGGLAATKIARELQRKQPSKMRFVTVQWVLDSIRAGKRLPESWYAEWRFVEKGQGDVRGFFGVAREEGASLMKKT